MILALPHIELEAQTLWNTESHRDTENHTEKLFWSILVLKPMRIKGSRSFSESEGSINTDYSFHKEKAIIKIYPFFPSGKGYQAKLTSFLLVVSILLIQKAFSNSEISTAPAHLPLCFYSYKIRCP